MPPDVHVTLWSRIIELLKGGTFCWNTEIWEELNGSISGEVGESLAKCNEGMCFEVGVGDWDWPKYLEYVDLMRTEYGQYISEYNGDRKGTVNLKDCSIVCLAKTLQLPVASMEKPWRQRSEMKMRIPELCDREGIEHYDLTRLMRAEGLTA